MVAKIQSEKASATTKNTISKTALQEQKNKDPNADVFTDTSGYVSESLNIVWSKIYSIFDNDEFSCVDHDQLAYLQIRNSQLHRIACRPRFMPYTDPVKWALDHIETKQGIFHDIHNVVIAHSVQMFLLGIMLCQPPSSFSRRNFSMKVMPNSITNKL